MTAESVKSLLAARTSALAGKEADSDEYSSFSCGRIGNRPQVMVTFEKATGESLTLAYTHLYAIRTANPNAGFTLQFSEDVVEVRGRHLERVLDLLAAHKLRTMREAVGGMEFDVSPHSTTPLVLGLEFGVISKL